MVLRNGHAKRGSSKTKYNKRWLEVVRRKWTKKSSNKTSANLLKRSTKVETGRKSPQENALSVLVWAKTVWMRSMSSGSSSRGSSLRKQGRWWKNSSKWTTSEKPFCRWTRKGSLWCRRRMSQRRRTWLGLTTRLPLPFMGSDRFSLYLRSSFFKRFNCLRLSGRSRRSKSGASQDCRLPRSQKRSWSWRR